jgi:hypothetical protein
MTRRTTDETGSKPSRADDSAAGGQRAERAAEEDARQRLAADWPGAPEDASPAEPEDASPAELADTTANPDRPGEAPGDGDDRGDDRYVPL